MYATDDDFRIMAERGVTLVRGLGGGLPLQRWLEEAIFPVEAKMTPEDVAAGAVWGALEMLAGGTTCVADMYDFPDAYDARLAEAGLKASVNRVGLAFADNVPPNRLAECIAYVARGCTDRINRDFCVHSEYLTNEKFCRELAAANREFRRPVHVHVSETEKEHRECLARHGKTPIATRGSSTTARTPRTACTRRTTTSASWPSAASRSCTTRRAT